MPSHADNCWDGGARGGEGDEPSFVTTFAFPSLLNDNRMHDDDFLKSCLGFRGTPSCNFNACTCPGCSTPKDGELLRVAEYPTGRSSCRSVVGNAVFWSSETSDCDDAEDVIAESTGVDFWEAADKLVICSLVLQALFEGNGPPYRVVGKLKYPGKLSRLEFCTGDSVDSEQSTAG